MACLGEEGGEALSWLKIWYSVLKTSVPVVERKHSHGYSRVYWRQSLSASPGAAQPSGTELCRFQEVLCSCFRDSYFSVPFGGSLCELLTSLRSPAVGMDLCRSLTFKFRITPLPAKYSQGGFYGGCKLWTIREEWLVLWVEQDVSPLLCWIIKGSPTSWGIYVGNCSLCYWEQETIPGYYEKLFTD